MKTTTKETTKFFQNKQEAWEFAKAIGSKEDYTVLDYGKSGRSFYIKYRKEEQA